MQLFVLGLSHKSAPVSVREKFALAEGRLAEFLTRVAPLSHVEEVLALSTCNRMEIYGVSSHPAQAQQSMIHFLSEFHSIERTFIEKHYYFYQGKEAVQHGFRVASSLDSMILGEPQILGQMKEAYRVALEAKTTGALLNKFFHRSFSVAKKIRAETSIGAHPVSVSYAAVVLAKQIFGDLADKKALILGAGKMSLLAIRHLKNAGIQKLYISNRTPERAQEIAQQVEGETIPFDKFEKWLSDADVVVTSTASEGYLVVPHKIQEVLRQRKHRPIFFIDIAVPRNVSPEINRLPNVYLYDIDDLGEVVEANKNERCKEAERAAIILQREVEDFAKVFSILKVVPTLSSLSNKFEKICRQELEKTFQKMPNLNSEQREIVETLASSIVNKILHDPMIVLKAEAPDQLEGEFTNMVRKLFRLDEV